MSDMTQEEKDAEIKRLTKQIQDNANQNIIKQSPKRNVTKEGQFFFGPYVPLCRVHDSLVTGLMNRGEKLESGTANSDLAGHLTDQRRYTHEDKKWFIREFKPYVDWYVKGALEWSGLTLKPEAHTTSFTLMDLWINYMKEHEYNPEHNHGGQLSWVIFCKNPDLSEEQKSFIGSSSQPGTITFHYGEPQYPKWADHTFTYKPQENYMWMFPAQLRHQVIPFHTKGTRISVSGNLYFNQPGSPDDISQEPNQING
tara:strand:+ start:87 stop:851 length:765 start_codon:yes stop_codon:yes gene_type:complete